MKVSIGADHGGFLYKEYLKENCPDVEWVDVGAKTEEKEDDYTDFSFAIAENVSKNKTEKGVMICRTGVGACIAMNKVKGVRAGVLENKNAVILARHKNDINCLCFGADNISKEEALKIFRLFLTEGFDGGRHARRVNKISEYEEKIYGTK